MSNMLCEAKNATFVPYGIFFTGHRFQVGKLRYRTTSVRQRVFDAMRAQQETQAVPIIELQGRQYWWCRGRFYWDDDGLAAADVYALVYERDRRKERQLERAHAVVATDALPQQPRRD